MVAGKSLLFIDRRTPFSSCSSIPVFMLVIFCVIGAWILSSKAFLPLGSPYTNKETKFVGKSFLTHEKASEHDSMSSRNEDNLGFQDKSVASETAERWNRAEESQGGGDAAGSGMKKNKDANNSQELSNVAQANELEQYNGNKDQEGSSISTADDSNIVNKPEDTENILSQTEKEVGTSDDNGKLSTESGSDDLKNLDSDDSYASSSGKLVASWKLCNTSAGADFIPCLDNTLAIKKLRSTMHYEHRERHCPEQPPTCLVELPQGYRAPIRWPISRNKIWYSNVPHKKLVQFKGHQNWIKVSGEYLTFPGGGTQFKHGALRYIDIISQAKKDIEWGERTRVVLDVGCGVASFGGYLFDRDVLTMSFAPKDEHEAQVQFALERGIPAISAVMGTKRLPFPSKVFDLIHCARCRVPWHAEGGKLLLELNRLLRPGGYFVWSATPVYQKLAEDVEIWHAMSALTKSICWTMVNKVKDRRNSVGVAIYRKPIDNTCYDNRKEDSPPLCTESDHPDTAWDIEMKACIHKLPTNPASWGTRWPENWPLRLEKPPYWLNSSVIGVYGKPLPEDFRADDVQWKQTVRDSYTSGLGIDWSGIRNVMDMRSVYGGFAAALQGMPLWVMNVVPIDSADTLPIIFERGLLGIYHDWCESFSTYPRTYDLLHADHLFSNSKNRCALSPVIAEVDRVLRPGGRLIVRDDKETLTELVHLANSLHWKIHTAYSMEQEGMLYVQKTMWRPSEFEAAILTG